MGPRALSRPQEPRDSTGPNGNCGAPKTFLSPSLAWKRAVSPSQDRKAPRGHCDEGVLAPAALQLSLPQGQACRQPLNLPLLPVNLEPELKAHTLWLCSQSWEPASKTVPFRAKPSIRKCPSLIIQFNVSSVPDSERQEGPGLARLTVPYLGDLFL